MPPDKRVPTIVGRTVLARLLLRYLLRRAQRADQRALRTGLVATAEALPSAESTLDTLRHSDQVRQLIERLLGDTQPRATRRRNFEFRRNRDGMMMAFPSTT